MGPIKSVVRRVSSGQRKVIRGSITAVFAGALVLGCHDDPTAPRPMLVEKSEPRLAVTIAIGSYTLTDLGTLGGPASTGYGINASGAVVGHSYAEINSQHAVLFPAGGGVVDLETPGIYSTALGINAAGNVVGYAQTVAAYYHAMRWPAGGGTPQDLGTLGGDYSAASAINDAGDIVGSSHTAGNAQQHATLWAGGGAARDLGTLGGTFSAGLGINTAGTAVGYSLTAGGAQHATRWPAGGGSAQDLGTLPGGTESVAYGINDAGDIVGYSSAPPNGVHHATLWPADGSGPIDLGTLGGPHSVAFGINAAGDIVGYSYGAGNGIYGAVLWPADRSGMRELATLGGNYSYGWAINSRGQISGISYNTAGRSRAVLWAPLAQPQAITFTATPPNPADLAGTYSIAATGGSSGNPVTFSSLTTAVCGVTDNSVALSTVGTCTIAADQAAGTGYLAAPQLTQTFEVVDGQAITFETTPPDPGVVGTIYKLRATGGASHSAVTFSSLTKTVCMVEGNAAILLAPGRCTIAADQAAGGGYLAAPQAIQSFVVIAPEPQEIGFTSMPPSPAIANGSYEVRADGGGSDNPVLFGSLTPSVCFVLGNTVSLITIGTCSVAADQKGNTFYLEAPQAVQTFDVYDVQAITFHSAPPSPGAVGRSYRVAATGGLSGNEVTFTSLSNGVCLVNGNAATLTGPGTCTIAADQAGSGGYLPAPQEIQSFAVIEPLPQIIEFTSPAPNPGIVNGSYAVSADGGGSGFPVLFGSFTPSVCFVLGNTVSLITRGTCRVAADQAGNIFYLDAVQAVQAFDVYDLQAVVFTSSPSTPVVGQPYSLTATGGLSGNSVTFSSLSNGVCTVSGATATLTGAGTCIIAADQAGGGGYLAAPQATQSFTIVEPIPQSISFTSSPPPRADIGGSYVAAATGGASPSPVVFSSLTEPVCSVNGNAVAFLSVGTCTLAADQAGNAYYLAATRETQSFLVVEPNRRPLAVAGGPYNGNEGALTTLDGSGSSDLDGDGLSYAWNFGDGSTGSGIAPTHAYADNGIYTVTLTVRDGLLDSQPATSTSTITNVAPTAAFASPSSVGEGSVFTISLGGATDPSSADRANGLHFALDCGSGYGTAVSYATAGTSSSTICVGGNGPATKSVMGKVFDKDGGSTEYGPSIVTINNLPPVVTISAPSCDCLTPTIVVSFTDPAGNSDGVIGRFARRITWGDGETTLRFDPIGSYPTAHTYAKGGSYTVTATVIDRNGAVGSATRVLQITQPVTIGISPTNITAATTTLRVTIARSSGFGARRLDRSSLRLGTTPVARNGSGAPRCSTNNSNLICLFDVATMRANGDLVGLGTRTLVLTGSVRAPDARPIRGAANVSLR